MLNLAPKVPVPEQEPVVEKVPEVPMAGLETLWLQVGGTLCNLACKHCFISCHPNNDTIPFMTLDQVRARLEEAKRLGVQDYYITGGEVFLNPEIFEILSAILEYGPCHILTNGMLLTPKRVERLTAIQQQSAQRMHFRVSLDSLDEQENDAIRGENCFRLAMQGVANLSQAGFSTHLTMVRSWDDEEDPYWEEKAIGFLKEHHVPDPKVKFLPGFLLGELARNERDYHPHERVTEKCFETFPITSLQCASSRMATSQGVYVCPILVEEPSAKMGGTLDETMRPFPLSHSACYTCRISGMSCKS